jgi:hypothetical protein
MGVETPTPPIETTTAGIGTQPPPDTTTAGIGTQPPPDTTTAGIGTQPPPGQTTEQPPLGPPELCVGNNFRYVANPNYCYRFYYCAFGLALPGECDPDRIFSERWRGCVLGDQATCTPNSPIVIVTMRTI